MFYRFFYFIFLSVNFKNTKLVEFISSSVFLLYIIHIGELKLIIFNDLFNNTNIISKIYISDLTGYFCLDYIYSMYFFIDKIRKYLIAKPLLKLFDPFVSAFLNEKLRKLIKKQVNIADLFSYFDEYKRFKLCFYVMHFEFYN